jgi:hypothetical protein
LLIAQQLDRARRGVQYIFQALGIHNASDGVVRAQAMHTMASFMGAVAKP